MKPRILVLEEIHEDGIELFKEFADVDVRLGMNRAEILDVVDGYEAVVVRSVVQVDQEFLASASKIRVVGRGGTGTENSDLVEARKRDVAVVTVPTGNSVSAAEFTVALILSLTRNVPQALQMVADGDFRRGCLEGRELTDLSIGLVGLGNVGTAVAQRLAPFGCQVIGWDPTPPQLESFEACGGTRANSFDDLLGQVDILSFHVRLDDSTKNMLDRRALALLKPGAWVVNTSRAGVIVVDALLEALDDDRLAGAAVDVLDPEPPFDIPPGDHKFDHPFLRHPKVLVTPHMAAATVEAQRRIARQLAEQIREIVA